MSAELKIEPVLSSDFYNGKLLRIIALELKDVVCSKPTLGLRDYDSSKHHIWVARQNNKVLGMIAFHRETVHLPEEPPKDVIIIDTLCAKDDIVHEELLKVIPVISYPTGRSPAGLPAGFTTPYNYYAEGDPKALLLPATAAKPDNNNNNYNNNYYNNNNSYNGNYTKPQKTLHTTNFTKKTTGSSVLFPKIQVKTGGRRHRRTRRNRTKNNKKQ